MTRRMEILAIKAETIFKHAMTWMMCDSSCQYCVVLTVAHCAQTGPLAILGLGEATGHLHNLHIDTLQRDLLSSDNCFYRVEPSRICFTIF